MRTAVPFGILADLEMVEMQFVEASFPSNLQAVRKRDGQIVGVLLDERIFGIEVDSREFQEMGRSAGEKSVGGAFGNQCAVGRGFSPSAFGSR